MSPQFDDERSASSRKPDLTLSTLGQAIALFVVLVPITGYLAYVVFFSLDSQTRQYDVFNLAITRSIPSLSIVGGTIWFLAFFSVFLEHFGAKREEESVAAVRRRRRIRVFFAVFVLLLFLFFDVYLALFFLVYVPIFKWSYAKWQSGSVFSFRELWRPFLVLLVMSLLISSTLIISSDTGFAKFARSSGMENGYYTVIADSGTDTYLLSCAAHPSLIEVNENEVLSLRFVGSELSSLGQGLIESVTKGKWPELEIGANSCPTQR